MNHEMSRMWKVAFVACIKRIFRRPLKRLRKTMETSFRTICLRAENRARDLPNKKLERQTIVTFNGIEYKEVPCRGKLI
jgi:hypothetical protein